MSDATAEQSGTEARENLHESQTRYGVPLVTGLDQPVLFPSREQLADVVRALHEDGFLMCLDITAVDYLTFGRRTVSEGNITERARPVPAGVTAERFEVVYHFINHGDGARIRVRVQVPEDDPTVPSLFGVHPGTEAMEREVYDMFGIAFTDHPDLTRILMPEDWIGHPLRKDYNSGRIPVQFKDAPQAR